jgi:hypothetical protein
MPTVLREGPYRFFFYASDRAEPVHIHVQRDANTAKYWLDPVRLQRSGGFNLQELGRIRAIIESNLAYLLESWNEYFNE